MRIQQFATRKVPRRLTSTACAMALLFLTGPGFAVEGSAQSRANSGITPDYVAGSAVAFTPTYDAVLWAKVYKCSYSGWAHVKVNWSCSLKDPYTGTTLSSHTGSFSGGSANPGYFTYRTSNVYLCTVASASYADGSDGDFDQKCG